MRLLWLSRHEPLPRQIDALKKLYGDDTTVIQDPQPFSSAEEIVGRFRNGKYDDIVVVAPLSVIARLIDLGLRPLWSQMDQVSLDQAEVQVKNRGYRFNRFRRVIALHLEFEEIE